MQGIDIPHCHRCLTDRADDSEVKSAAKGLCFLGPGEIQLLAKDSSEGGWYMVWRAQANDAILRAEVCIRLRPE